jgi:hypothetical protein
MARPVASFPKVIPQSDSQSDKRSDAWGLPEVQNLKDDEVPRTGSPRSFGAP